MSGLQGNPHEEIRVGMQVTGVIDGIFDGGYWLTIRVGNGVTLRGSMFTSGQPSLIEGHVNVNVPFVPNASNSDACIDRQNTGNSEAHIDLNTKKKIPEFEVDDDFSPDYSYFEISAPSHEIQIPDPLLYSGKVEPVVFKPFNPSRGGAVPTNQTNSLDKGKGIYKDCNSTPPTGQRISRDPFLPRNFPSPAVTITPPDDLRATTSWPSKQGEKKAKISNDFDLNVDLHS